MRIAIDLSAVRKDMVGPVVYCKGFLTSLAKIDSNNEYLVFLNHEKFIIILSQKSSTMNQPEQPSDIGAKALVQASLKLAKAIGYKDCIKVGSYVDIKDDKDTWRVAKVLIHNKEKNLISVTYDG